MREAMENGQFWAIISMMGAGFGWLIYQVRDLDKKIGGLETRITVIVPSATVMWSSCAL